MKLQLNVMRSRQICIYVVEALLVATYPEEKDAYMHIRPTLMPEASLPRRACPASGRRAWALMGQPKKPAQ